MADEQRTRVPLAERLAAIEEQERLARIAQQVGQGPSGASIYKFVLGLIIIIGGIWLLGNAIYSDHNRRQQAKREETPSRNSGYKGSEEVQMANGRPGHISESNENRLTTYATALGRASGCGIDISPQGTQMGRWIRSVTAPGADEASMMAVFKGGLIAAEAAQINGETPDRCNEVRASYLRFSWPDAP